MKKMWKKVLINYKLGENRCKIMKFFQKDYLMRTNNIKKLV